MDTQVVFHLGLIWIKLLHTFFYSPFCNQYFYFFWVNTLNCLYIVRCTLNIDKKLPIFKSGCTTVHFHQLCMRVLGIPHFCQLLVAISLFNFSHLSGCIVLTHYDVNFHFPDKYATVFLNVLIIGYLHIFLFDASVQIFPHFYLIVFSLLNYSSSYSLDTSLLSFSKNINCEYHL